MGAGNAANSHAKVRRPSVLKADRHARARVKRPCGGRGAPSCDPDTTPRFARIPHPAASVRLLSLTPPDLSIPTLCTLHHVSRRNEWKQEACRLRHTAHGWRYRWSYGSGEYCGRFFRTALISSPSCAVNH